MTTLSIEKSYIGASDAESEGTWKWTDGTTWGFQNWAPGEPNNYGGSQMYGAINYQGVGLWDDESEFYPRPFFCQYDLGKCPCKQKFQKNIRFDKNLQKNLTVDCCLRLFIYFPPLFHTSPRHRPTLSVLSSQSSLMRLLLIFTVIVARNIHIYIPFSFPPDFFIRKIQSHFHISAQHKTKNMFFCK